MRFLRKIGLCVVVLLMALPAQAQLYPSEAFFVIQAPLPVYLADYASPAGQNISLRLLFRDFELGNRSVRLKFGIAGQGLQINNIPGPQYPQFELTAGVPLVLEQADIFSHFLPQNLDVSPQQYTTALPEGVYRFTVEVIDAESNRPISGLLQSKPYWLLVSEPPIINLPAQNAKVKPTIPQQLLFQWTPRNKQPAAMEYDFSLTEIIVPDGFEGNLQNIYHSLPTYFQTSTNSTTLLYGPGEPPLINGRYYGVQIRAKAKKGFEEIGIFSNEGQSQVTVFQYAEAASPLVKLQEELTDKATVATDTENYLKAGFGNLLSQKDNIETNTPSKIGQKRPLSIGDSLRFADIWVHVAAADHVLSSIAVPDFGSKTIKLYFADSLVINNIEIASGGLSSLPTGQKIELLPKASPYKLVENKPNLLSSLLLLEDAKNTNNLIYQDIRSHALRKPNDIRELNLKLNGLLVLLKDKATLLDRVMRHYSGSVVYTEVSPLLVREKKRNDANINNIQSFLKKYESYYKNDFAQIVLKYLPDAPQTSTELALYSDLIQIELDRLAQEKIKEHDTGILQLKKEHDGRMQALGAIPANMNTGETKRLEERLETEIRVFNENLDKKYIKLTEEVYSKYKKITSIKN
jgi:hypothetical protein